MIGRIFGAEALENFELVLKQNSGRNSLKGFFEQSMIASVFLLLAGFAAALELGLGENALIAATVLSFAVPLMLNYFIQLMAFERRKRKIEEIVPDALLQAASIPSGNDFSKTLKCLSAEDFGELGKEFSKAGAELLKGASVQECLDGIAKRNCSKIVGRMCLLLKQGFESDADLSSVFRETAEDIIETRNIIKERQATLTVQKITLVFAGALIVPMVLGLLSGIVKDFDIKDFEELGVGLDAGQRHELQNAAQTATVLYIIEYAFIASFFAAMMDNDLKKGALYSLFLVPCGLGAFIIAGML